MTPYSLNDVDFFHHRVTDITAIELVGVPIKAASEGVPEPDRADFFHGCVVRNVRICKGQPKAKVSSRKAATCCGILRTFYDMAPLIHYACSLRTKEKKMAWVSVACNSPVTLTITSGHISSWDLVAGTGWARRDRDPNHGTQQGRC